MARDSGFVDAPAGPLFYEVQGTGPTLVLLHSGNLDRRAWDFQFDVLAEEFRVVRYDIRPFGRSAPATNPYAETDDLKHLLDELGILEAALMGLSYGGRIAIDFALSYPDRLTSLVLVGSGLSGYQFSAESRQAAYRAAYERGGLEEVVETSLRGPYLAPAMEDKSLAPILSEIAHDNGHVFLPESRPYAPSELEPPAIERLGEITVPTLVVTGDRDVPDIHAIGDLLEAGIRGARRELIRGAGHIVNMEAATEFNDITLKFLRDHLVR